MTIELGPKAVLAVSMLLHELATNAENYGALSNETGRVCLRCDVDGDVFAMTLEAWRSAGVGAGKPRLWDSHYCDGSRGNVDTDFLPEGLTVRVEAGVTELQHV